MSAWRSAALALGAAALLAGCGEELVAPGECPSLCPGADVDVADTSLTGVVSSDDAFRGFVAPHEAGIMVLSTVDTNEAAAVSRFFPRSDFWFETSLLDTLRIASIDSTTLTIRVLYRDTSVRNTRILIYRAPRSIDTTATYDTLLLHQTPAALVDSFVLDSTTLGDSLASGSITIQVPPALVEPDTVDSGVVALVFALRSDSQTVVTLATTEFAGAPRLNWSVRAADTTKKHTFTLTPAFDSFGAELALPGVTAGSVSVGGIPSARALLRLDIPRFLVDSTTIIRATLLLTPVRAAGGIKNDTFAIEAWGIVRDFGPKSFFTPEGGLFGSVSVARGDTSQIELDITNILRTWRGIDPDSLPRTLLLRLSEEGSNPADIEIARSTAGAAAPVLRITYIKPYSFGLP